MSSGVPDTITSRPVDMVSMRAVLVAPPRSAPVTVTGTAVGKTILTVPSPRSSNRSSSIVTVSSPVASAIVLGKRHGHHHVTDAQPLRGFLLVCLDLVARRLGIAEDAVPDLGRRHVGGGGKCLPAGQQGRDEGSVAAAHGRSFREWSWREALPASFGRDTGTVKGLDRRARAGLSMARYTRRRAPPWT